MIDGDMGAGSQEVLFLSLKPFLITSSSLKINDRDRSNCMPALQHHESNDSHNNLVDRILDALQQSNPKTQIACDADCLGGMVETDDDMTLVQYQGRPKPKQVQGGE